MHSPQTSTPLFLTRGTHTCNGKTKKTVGALGSPCARSTPSARSSARCQCRGPELALVKPGPLTCSVARGRGAQGTASEQQRNGCGRGGMRVCVCVCAISESAADLIPGSHFTCAASGHKGLTPTSASISPISHLHWALSSEGSCRGDWGRRSNDPTPPSHHNTRTPSHEEWPSNAVGPMPPARVEPSCASH